MQEKQSDRLAKNSTAKAPVDIHDIRSLTATGSIRLPPRPSSAGKSEH